VKIKYRENQFFGDTSPVIVDHTFLKTAINEFCVTLLMLLHF